MCDHPAHVISVMMTTPVLERMLRGWPADVALKHQKNQSSFPDHTIRVDQHRALGVVESVARAHRALGVAESVSRAKRW